MGLQARPIPTYETLSYIDFLKKHILPNTPCLLSSTATAHWPARRLWAHQCDGTVSSKPDIDGLRPFEHHVVPVANTHKRLFSEFERRERTLREVLDFWDRGSGEELYVKDWHLMAVLEKEGRSVTEVYEVPECFRDDWLNPPFNHTIHSPINNSGQAPSTSDFRFTYAGPSGTFTPLHRDVYASYSWSANIVGRKIWWLFPPDKLGSVQDQAGDLVFDVRTLDNEGDGIKILQQEGEIIFVPSGWHHQVVNVDLCISINHNFLSSPTLPRVFSALEQAQNAVEESIEDVKSMIQGRLGTAEDQKNIPAWECEWTEEVQNLLKMDAGWGWKGFWETVRDNLRNPPAVSDHSPPRAMVREFILEVVSRYQKRREWVILADVRIIIQEVEALISAGSS